MSSSSLSPSFALVFVALAIAAAAAASPAVAARGRRVLRVWRRVAPTWSWGLGGEASLGAMCRAMCRAMGDALVAFDDGGTIIWANPAAEQMFAAPPGGLAGLPLHDLLPTFERDALSRDALSRDALSRDAQAGDARAGQESSGRLTSRELPARRTTGDEIIVELVVSATRSRGRTLFSGVLRDITARLAGERHLLQQLHDARAVNSRSVAEAERLTAARDNAEQAARAMGDFLTTMSHELQAPMSGVMGMAQQLLHTALSDEQTRRVQSLKRSGEPLLRIIDDVLDFSSIEAGRLRIDWKPFDLMVLLEEVREAVAPAAEIVGLSLTLEVDAKCPRWVLGDGGRIRQVLLNLAWNAIKFTDQGRVTITARPRPGPDEQTIVLEVMDTGVGMSEQTVAALFSPFVFVDGSATRRHGGAGLGLVISMRLAEMMDGTLSVTSALGVGSQFTLALPLPATTPPVPIALAAPALDVHWLREVSPAAHGLRVPHVLVAEDNLINQMLAVSLLAHLGCTVDVATDGRDAVRRWSEGTYDLILMDCQMPEMDGLEATRIIRAAERAAERGAARTPIIALTTNATADDVAACLQAGMDEHLPKPATERALAEVLTHYRPALNAGQRGRCTAEGAPAIRSRPPAPGCPATAPAPADCAR